MPGSAETVEYWCHDCRDDRPFEVVPGVHDAAAREWACIACGAAYIEAFDVAMQIETDVRGVA